MGTTRTGVRALLALAAAGLLLGLSGCAGAGGGDPAGAAADVGPEHVHGLGVNPADGALYIATHTGLFRMPPGSDGSERVGDRLQDTMGFAVAGPDHFLGSGHPDLRDGLPPLLGLIESSDAGRSWTPVSLLGEADFHALGVSGSRVVGYDASGGRLMASADRGRRWTPLGTPGEIADLALDPDDPSRIVATGDTGVITTTDGGATWTRLPADAVVLAWPAAGALYGFDADGGVAVSRDRGGTWERVGDLGGEPAAATSTTGGALIVALHDGRIVSSGDGGASWAEGAWSGQRR
ncbi:MAG: F510_1955 family glycosylhydrolase [Thermoleophilia bacterium]